MAGDNSGSRPAASPGARRVLHAVLIAVLASIVAVGAFLKFNHDPARDLWEESRRMMNRGDDAVALDLLTAIRREYPSSKYAEYARAILEPELPAEPGDTLPLYDGSRDDDLPEDERLYREAQSFFPKGAKTRSDLLEAARRYAMLADSFPRSRLAGDALYFRAQCLGSVGSATEQIEAWERLIQNYPHHGQTAEALYALGYIHANEMGRPDAGEKYFRELIERFPRSNSAEAARHSLGIAEAPEAEPPAVSQAAPSGAPTIITTPGGR